MKTNIYPNPWDLRYFQEIAHTQNLSRAAERLGVGQPALSLALKRLEETLETSLFYRRNKGLSLTAAGQLLLKESNRLLSDWESLVSQTKKSETDLIGRYSVGCHPSIALYTLNNVVRDIYSNYPGIELQLNHGLSRIITEQVISGDVDFGLVVNPVRHPDLIIHEMAKDEVGFYKSAKGLTDVLLYHPALIQSQTLLKRLKKKTFARTVTSESLEVLAVLAKSGAGVAILPERVVKVLAPELKRLENSPTYQDQVAFIFRADLRKTASAKIVIEQFKNLTI